MTRFGGLAPVRRTWRGLLKLDADRAFELRSIAYRFALAGAGWWIISEGELTALAIGVPAVIAAVALSRLLVPKINYSLHPLGLLQYLGFFLKQSVIAGLEVAWIILQPALPVKPGMVRLRLMLAEGGPRWLLVDTLTLLPGTLSVSVEDDELIVHCLNRDKHIEAAVRDIERRVAAVYGIHPGHAT